MGNLSKKVKKKKSRKAKAEFTSLSVIAAAIGFLYAVSAFYLREVYNIKTLAPSWRIAKSDVIFSAGDITILKRDLALKMLVDSNLLVAEQMRLVATVGLIFAIAHLIGKSWLHRMSIFAFMGGLCGMLYYVILFGFLRWPISVLAKDVVTLFPLPVVVPVYMPFLLSVLVFTGGILLVFKKK